MLSECSLASGHRDLFPHLTKAYTYEDSVELIAFHWECKKYLLKDEVNYVADIYKVKVASLNSYSKHSNSLIYKNLQIHSFLIAKREITRWQKSRGIRSPSPTNTHIKNTSTG